MKLGTKLFLLITVPTGILLLFFSIYVASQIDRLGANSGELMHNNFQSVLAAQRMDEAVERMDSAALARLSGHWDFFAKSFEQNRKIFERSLLAQEENVTEPEERSVTSRLREKWQVYQKDYELFLKNDDESHTYYIETLLPSFQAVKNVTNRILEMNQDAMLRKSKLVESYAKSQVRRMTAVSCVVILLLFVWSGWLLRKILRPLSVLSQAVRRVGTGDWSIRVLERGNDEIANLAHEFNQMTAHLAEYRNSSLGDLLKAKQVSQAAIDSLPDPVLIYGIQGEFINGNAAAEKTFGFCHQTFIDEKFPEDFRRQLSVVCHFVLAGHGEYAPKGYGESIRYQKVDGNEYRFLLRGHPLYNEHGQIIGVTVLCQNITKLYDIYSLKTNLVTSALDELKPPLLSLETAFHVCLEEKAGELNEKQAGLMFAARQDCHKLKDHIEELLDLARLQSDQGIE